MLEQAGMSCVHTALVKQLAKWAQPTSFDSSHQKTLRHSGFNIVAFVQGN